MSSPSLTGAMPECAELKRRYDDCYERWRRPRQEDGEGRVQSLHECNDVFEVMGILGVCNIVL
jgi:hypothetical protein